MSDACCGRALDTKRLQAQQRRVLLIVLVINLVTFVMMILAAWATGSSSLLSGGLDNLGDAATYVLSFMVVASTGRAKASVALFKGALILAAAVAVAAQIAWRLGHPNVPIFEGMGAAAIANLVANLVCLRLLTPYKSGDVNMSSAWECSRNDVFEGFGVIAASVGVWLFGSGWPDVIVAAILLVLFLRSSSRVFGSALVEFRRVSAA